MRRLLLALAVSLWAGTAQAQGALGDPEITFHGGPYDGLVIGDVVRPDNGVRMRGLKPSIPGSSPVPAAAKASVSGMLRAYRKGRRHYEKFLADGAKGVTCQDLTDCDLPVDFEDFPFEEQCSPNVPYLTPDGRVRLEWSYKGMLYYLSWLKMRGGKVAEVETHRADVPRLLIRPAQDPSHG